MGILEAIIVEALRAIEEQKKKVEIETKAHSAILLSLEDEVLRKVAYEEKALRISWHYLHEEILANKLYLKKKLYTLRMEDSKEFKRHLNDFTRLFYT
uniref:Uncharacterized protein n=1 Tax=Cannabis sativa TaxID=3483 RepID=A0A803PQ56_CANSA